NKAEDGVPNGRLPESAGVREERRDAFRPAGRVVPVDEVRERVERDMLGERHAEGQPSRLDCGASPQRVEGEAEKCAVDGLDTQPPCPPPPAPRTGRPPPPP